MLEFLQPAQSVPGLDVRILVAVAFTATAACYDVFNKKWVPNWLLYAFVGAALLLNIIFFQPEVFSQAIVFGAAAFIISYPLYRLGQLGGADVYAYAAIAAAVPYLPKPLLAATQSIPYPFILSVLAPTGLAFILHMLARFIPYISRKIAKGKVDFGYRRLAAPATIVIAFAFFAYALSSLPVQLPVSYLAVLSFLFVSLVFFSSFKQEIKESMVEMLPVRALQAEDVLALEQMDRSVVKRLSLSPLLTAKSIAALKKSRLKKVPVYTGMPFFLPYLLFGLVFTVLFGDLIFMIVSSPLRPF